MFNKQKLQLNGLMLLAIGAIFILISVFGDKQSPSEMSIFVLKFGFVLNILSYCIKEEKQ